MTTEEEAWQQERDYAQALGFLAMRAGDLEWELRLEALRLAEGRPRGSGLLEHDAIKRGKGSASQLIENIRKDAVGRIDNEKLRASYLELVDEAASLMEIRNRLLHSPQVHSIFYEPYRLDPRGGPPKNLSLDDIRKPTFDMIRCTEKVRELFMSEIYFKVLHPEP